MTSRDDLDRSLAAWLSDRAPMSEPEHLLGQVLARTARTRRRPAWRIPERWIPMSAITTRAAPASRFPLRTVALVGVLAVALAAVAIIVAGSRANRLPAPFGPAANGMLAFSVNGDIVVADSPTGPARTIIGGSTFDSGPLYAPDGTKLLFVRGTMASDAAEMWAADADGSNPRRLAATPQIGWAEWSPQGDAIAVSLDGDQSIIRLIAADGSGATDIQTGLAVAENPIFRPPDGRQLTFRGRSTDAVWGIYVIDRDGTNLQRLDLDPGFQADLFYDLNSGYYFNRPSWSADGRLLLYDTLEPAPTSPAGPGFRLHVAEVGPDGAVVSDRMREFDPTVDDEFGAALLASGDVVFQTIEGSTHRLLTGALTGDEATHDLGVTAGDWITDLLAPDGRTLMVWSPSTGGAAESVSLVDVTTGVSTPLDLTAGDVNWQRVAP
jgi:Tol biopolymer transport system component